MNRKIGMIHSIWWHCFLEYWSTGYFTHTSIVNFHWQWWQGYLVSCYVFHSSSWFWNLVICFHDVPCSSSFCLNSTNFCYIVFDVANTDTQPPKSTAMFPSSSWFKCKPNFLPMINWLFHSMLVSTSFDRSKHMLFEESMVSF